MSDAQIEAMHDTNLNLLIMMLGGVDVVLSTYGTAVCQEEVKVKHSDADKSLTAHAQYAWMLEKGINPSAYLGTGTIAAALTGYYVIPPLMKIRRRSKVRLFTGLAFNKVGNIFSRIPLIGRFFRKRQQQVPVGVNRDE